LLRYFGEETKRVVATEAKGYDSSSEAAEFEAQTEAVVEKAAAAEVARHNAEPPGIGNRPTSPIRLRERD
jgi:hypothetical protein